MGSGYYGFLHSYEEIMENYYDFKTIKIVRATNFTEYVESVYDEIKEKYYFEHRYACDFLNIPNWKLKELILDMVYSDLYIHFLVMKQYVLEKEFHISHEMFLTMVDCNKELNVTVSQTCKERFRRRMQPSRLGLMKKIKMPFGEDVTFYSPTLIRAFKETILIGRVYNSIVDISKNYVDLFYSLMFDADEEDETLNERESRERIKAYRLWELNEKDVEFIFVVYENSFDSRLGGNKVAQLILLEKLFGIYTMAELLKQNKFKNRNISAMNAMRCFGFSSLHKFLISKITNTNSPKIKKVTRNFLVPFCTEILHKVIRNSFLSMEYKKEVEQKEYLEKLLSVCKNKGSHLLLDDSFEILRNVKKTEMVEAIKWMNWFGTFYSTEHMANYISKNTRKSFEEDFYSLKYRINPFSECLFDKSLIDLTFGTLNEDVKYDINEYENFLGKSKLYTPGYLRRRNKLFEDFEKNFDM